MAPKTVRYLNKFHELPVDQQASRLRERLLYDPDSGIFIWRIGTWNKPTLQGKRAGGKKHRSYRRIALDGREYYEHRLAWLYVHGHWPPDQIDHINLSGGANGITNLREANNAENNRNHPARTHNTSGFKGVSFHAGAQKWTAQIQADKQYYYLGLFSSQEEAAKAYAVAAKNLHGEFSRIK